MIGYLHMMSDEEVRDYHEKLDEWWIKIGYDIKGHIRMLIEPLLKIRDCKHIWRDTDDYKNDFKAGTMICMECGEHKIKNET